MAFLIYQLIILWTITIKWHRWLLVNNHISNYNSFILVLYRRYINHVSVCPPTFWHLATPLFNIKQTNKNTLTKTISDLRIFQAFCNEPEIVIVPVSRKCTKTRRWWHVLVGPNLWPLFAKSSIFNMLPKCFGTFLCCSWGTLLHIVKNYVY